MINGLYVLLVWELVLGGGGRLFPIGPITLRIVIFLLTLVVWFVATAQGRHKSGQALALSIVYAFFVAHLPALLTDAISLQQERQQFAQIQGLLFFLSAPFIAMAVSSTSIVQRTARIWMIGGVLSGIGFALATLLVFFGVINFATVYQWSLRSEEFAFRTESVFYAKGLIFISIALMFQVILRPRFWAVSAAFLALCLIASLTRGLVAAAFIAILFALIRNRRYGAIYILATVLLIGGIIYIGDIRDFFVGAEDRASSLQGRLDDFQALFSQFTLRMLVMGEGFASSLNGRHAIENTYAWALWRFGILGLLFWISPFLISYYFYKKIKLGSKYSNIATAYFSGMIFVALATATNPVINNSIGILYSLIAIFSLRQLSISSSNGDLQKA